MKLFAFAASHRKESINRKLVKLAASFAEKQGANIDFAEYASFDMPAYDDEMHASNALPGAAQDFIYHVGAADGIILASPEYNWSFPGSLKNIIDWASAGTQNPFAGKTALLLSASPSLRGGAQGLVQLKVPLEALGMYVFPRVFTLARALAAFDAGGALMDAKLVAELEQLAREFCAMTKALTPA